MLRDQDQEETKSRSCSFFGECSWQSIPDASYNSDVLLYTRPQVKSQHYRYLSSIPISAKRTAEITNASSSSGSDNHNWEAAHVINKLSDLRNVFLRQHFSLISDRRNSLHVHNAHAQTPPCSRSPPEFVLLNLCLSNFATKPCKLTSLFARIFRYTVS